MIKKVKVIFRDNYAIEFYSTVNGRFELLNNCRSLFISLIDEHPTFDVEVMNYISMRKSAEDVYMIDFLKKIKSIHIA